MVFSPSLLSLHPFTQKFRFLSPLRFSISNIHSSTLDFNPTSHPQNNPSPNPNHNPLTIPWNMQSHMPARFLQAMEEAKEKKEKRAKVKKDLKSGEEKEKKKPPAYSKAARRFYNERFREPVRLSKVLAAAGVASRRSSEELIFEGKVTVNGSVCTSPQTRVDILKDQIYVNGNRLSKKLPPKLYFALNKPKGYICSNGKESKSVTSLFDEFWKTWNKTNPGVPKPLLFTVGRLDVATSGLIIVTNDGDFAQNLAHPSSELSKEYIATVEGNVQRRHLIAISEGTNIEGVHCVPDFVELLPTQRNTAKSRLRIVVHEGRNHEVRELVKHAGLQLYSLKRVRIGGYRLPADLGLGKYTELKPADLKLMSGATQKS